jgi:hypothetical protein
VIDGELILVESLNLVPATEDVSGLVGDHAAYGTLILTCPTDDAEALLALVRRVLPDRTAARAGASLLHQRRGVAVRVLGLSSSLVGDVLRAAISTYRDRFLGP